MARDSAVQSNLAKAHSVFIRLVLPPYTVHFKSPSYMKDATLEILDKRICKEILKATASKTDVREAIGNDEKIWADLCTLLKAAIPSLERRSFTIWDPSSVDYESTSGALIASHYPGLWKDLERLNDLISIGRNVLAIGSVVQDLAAAHEVDAKVFRLINCCVRVTARGYDGDAGTGDEEKWQWVVNAYKKLLITSLQFLNNLVARNEKRKLMLWTSLFDGSDSNPLAPEDVPETSSASLTDVPSNPTSKPSPPVTRHDMLVAFGTDGVDTVDTTDAQPLWDDTPFSDYPLPRQAIEGREDLEGNGYAFYVKRVTQSCVEDYNIERSRDPTLGEIHLDMPRRWSDLFEDDHEYWQRLYEDALVKYRQDLAVYQAKMLALTEQQPVLRNDVPVAEQAKHVEQRIAMIEEQLAEKQKSTEKLAAAILDPPHSYQEGPLTVDNSSLRSRSNAADDMRMLFTADAGSKILESGKAELMKRLEGYEQPRVDQGSQSVQNSHRVTSPQGRVDEMMDSPELDRGTDPDLPTSQTVPGNEETMEQNMEEDDEEELEEESEDDVEDDEEDYPGSTEDGRGLLTDVPLILGPSEIEVLPMLIMSGIVPPADQADRPTTEDRNALLNIHTIRTHLLLAQSNGRNLLRELLIFVAAWDLREDELYFKFMVKIMEAILNNGLMPYAYHAFRDRSRSKDIISPAQAVIMKLLTTIFRTRGETAKAAVAANAQNKANAASAPETTMLSIDRPSLLPNAPSRVDLHILNFIFTEFRQHIIPQTCALIFLQGQIHAGRASPEDFPLNLWDMERMYEGVYQYLEFFAVLTEEGIWKGILGEWEMASELVTLLRELEGGIPKMGTVVPQIPKRVPSQPQRAVSADGAPGTASPAPVAIERPFDTEPHGSDADLPPLPPHPIINPVPEVETSLPYPEDPVIPLGHDLQHDQDEPSDFEWRNLKKLTVLVLSSLIWKNRMVQDQVRRYGGLEALVGCCKADEHNPYIREHAIMCLRFAVEGCEENARVIRKMAAAQNQRSLEGGSVTLSTSDDVPREVLDTNGYETFMDPKGQVGLRRKDGAPVTAQPHQTTTSSTTGPSGAGVSKPRLNTPKMTAEKAAELMTSVLKDLPIGGKFVTDNQKAEAMAKLDKAFEGGDAFLDRGKKG